MTIHTIGDSHSHFGWDDTVVKHGLGPILAFSIGNGRLDMVDTSNFNLQPNDWFIFSFGEIDCRCHIAKHITETDTYQVIIKNIVEKYIAAVAKFVKGINMPLNIGIYNVIPPKKIDTGNNADFPFIGSSYERLRFVQYFNECLESEVSKYNYTFINILKFYTTDEGFLNPALADVSVHIIDGQMLMNHVNSLCEQSA